ncbi:MAG: hypothetical protein LBP33_13465 [Candidatus Adiutrix sp.]|nr:hypothetical protein [Candidatus Adiutrix sp.]
MIFDTDVLIWFMRGKPEAAHAASQDTLHTGNLKHFKSLGIKVSAFSFVTPPE